MNPETKMATARVNIPHHKEKEEVYTFESFKNNIKQQWSNKRQPDESHKKTAQGFPKVLLALQCPSQLYLFVFYIIPRLFEDYDDMTRLCLQFFACFCCAEGLINYFCTIFSDSTVKYTDLSSNKHLEIQNSQSNGHVQNGITIPRDDGGMPWLFCDKCNMNTPPRSHHCKVCNSCILKRDHHCFMVGTCIGFYNQRYFFVLGFYAIMCGMGGFIATVWYLQVFYWPTAYSWTSLFPPIIFFRWLFGYEQVDPHMIILIFQAYPELFFGGFGFIVVNAQMMMAVTGKTVYEISAQIPIKSNKYVHENFESVFGKCWMLNFIFPMTCIFKQEGDGYHWDGVKIDHNSNEKDHVTINI